MGDKTGIAWTDATCSVCRERKPRAAFPVDRSRPRGFGYVCKSCRNESARARYERVGPECRRRPGPARIPRRDGDKRQARSRINHDVRMGLRPNPNTVACVDCGHLGTDRRHEHDHHLGYAKEHHGDVEVVCSRCHHTRERARRAA